MIINPSEEFCNRCRAYLDNRVKSIVFITLIAFLFLLSATQASATNGNLSTILADTYVATENNNNNGGDSTAYIQIVPNNAYEHRPYFQWDMAAYKGVSISTATLWVYVSYNENTFSFGAYDVINNSAISDAMIWGQQPCGGTIREIRGSCNSTTADANVSIIATGWKTFNVTGALNRASTANQDYFTLAFMQIADPEQGGFRTKEGTSNFAFINFTYEAPPSIQKPNITITYPTDNASHVDRDIYPFSVNGTINSPDGIYNVSIDAAFMQLTSNQTEITNTFINFKFTESSAQADGNYSFKINSSNIGGTSYANIALYLDTANPILSISPEGSCIAASNTIGSFASDTNLYRHTSSLFRQNITGLSPLAYKNLNLFSSSENTNIVTTTDTINLSINPAADPNGIYRLETNASDSHTLAMIPIYEVLPDNSQKEISFTTKDNEINFKLVEMFFTEDGKNPIDVSRDFVSMESIKSLDKYSIQIPFAKEAIEPKGQYFYKFTISASQPIIKVAKNTGFKGHFVSGNNWIDFEPYEVTINPIDKNNWEVSFYTSEKDISFNSLGELNTISTSGIYLVSNAAPTISSLSISNNTEYNISTASEITPEAICYSPIGISPTANLTISLSNSSWSSSDCTGGFLSNYTASSIGTGACSIGITSLSDGNYSLDYSCSDRCSVQSTLTHNIIITSTYAPPAPPSPPANTTPVNMSNQLGSIANISSCTSTMPEVSIIALFLIFALALTIMGFVFRITILNIFGGVAFFFLGFYVVGCISMFGYLSMFLGILLVFLGFTL